MTFEDSSSTRSSSVSELRTVYVRVDQFYDWIYQRGLARLAARGITPQKLYAMLHGEAAQ